MVVNSQRTIYAMKLALHQQTGVPIRLLPNTTLNDKFNFYPVIYRDELPAYPTLKYICLGVGGISNIPSQTEYNYSQHRACDAGLFSQIPFLMREEELDIPLDQQIQYRFRMLEDIKGKTYACYYLKTLPLINIPDYYFKIQSQNNVDTMTQFDTNVASILNPVPIDKESRMNMLGENGTSYVTTVAKARLQLLPHELKELSKVCELRGIDTDTITEIGLCTGLDVPYGDRIEASAVQIAYHVGVDINLTLYLKENGQILREIEIGGMEGMVL